MVGQKVICIKDFKDFDGQLIKHFLNIKVDYQFLLLKTNVNIVKSFIICTPDSYKKEEWINCYSIKGRNYTFNDDNHIFYIPIEIFSEHFITLAELREIRINKILA